MSRYTRDELWRIRLQARVREWARSGLLTEDQRIRIEPELAVDLRRTNIMLRLGLGLFTIVAAGAAVILAFVLFELNREGPLAVMCLLLGGGAYLAADAVVARFRLYRYGVEEALAALTVLLCGVGVASAAMAIIGSSHESIAFSAALVACATVSAGLYARFGFQYAAVAAMAFGACVPLAMDGVSPPIRHLLVCALFLAAYAVARRLSQQHDDLVQDDASMVAACAVVGAYLAMNVYASIGILGIWRLPIEPWFKWTSYAVIWLIPVVAIWRGVADRERRVLRAGAAIALLTLITNKLYFGWPHQTWDPVILGVFLMGVAIFLRRWFAWGPGGERRGFTPARILYGDMTSMRVAGLASAAIHFSPDRPAPSSSDSEMFRGGRSGGGGASGDF